MVAASAIIVAVKPQIAPQVLPKLAGWRVRDRHGGDLDHGGPHARLPRERRCPRRPRWCAPCPTRRPRSAAASRSRCPMAGERGAARARRPAAARDRRGRMGGGRSPDGCGDRGVGLGPGLRVPARREPRARRRRRRPARGSRGAARARDCRGRRRAVAPLGARCRDLAPERHLAGRHHGGGARRADGRRTASIR